MTDAQLTGDLNVRFAPNVLLVDANYVDSVVYDFIVHLEHDLQRHFEDVDLAQLVICQALDGGVPKKEKEEKASSEGDVQVVFVYHKGESRMGHLLPSNIETEVNGFAFKDEYFGEFVLSAYEEDPHMVKQLGGGSVYVQIAHMMLNSPDIERLVFVTDWKDTGASLLDFFEDSLRANAADPDSPRNISGTDFVGKISDNRVVTAITTSMPEQKPDGIEFVNMGFSILHCLGVGPDELGAKG